MEIKKGISQMPEFLNQEINYVIPSDGKMYYVLKDGILEDGTVIATLDPKYAFDQTIPCSTVGAFKEDGSVLIDFDKKEIKRIDKDLLLAVASMPTSGDVLDALSKENDEISKSMILDNSSVIRDEMIKKMGITGEMLFSDAFSEANVYRTDSYNNKLGIDCSFIGKNDSALYFHTNNVGDEVKEVNLAGTSIPTVEEISDSSFSPDSIAVDVMENGTKNNQELNQNFSLDIDPDILNGFTKGNDSSEKKELEEESSAIEEKDSDDFSQTNKNESDEIFDNAIDVIKKMIEETNKLNEKIGRLEKKIEEQNEIIEKQESRKNELNHLVDQANEVLESID